MNWTRRFAASALFILALAACGATPETATENTGSSGTQAQANAESNAADVRFAMAMAKHHRQTIEMAGIIQVKDGVSEEIQSQAVKIKSVHEPETAQLEGMLRAWGGLTGTAESQRSHAAEQYAAEGMVGPEQMEELAAATGDDAEQLFLELMIAHHEATIAVAEGALAKGSNPEAMALARTIVETQRQELDRMRAMLDGYSAS